MEKLEKPRIIITVSEARTGKNCLQEYDYKYRMGFQPKLIKRPLKLGNWLHSCLENSYQDMGWRGALEDLIRNEWNPLFPEEQVMLGNLPEDTLRIMEGYEHFYKDDEWELVLPPEVKFEVPVETRDYIIVFRGRIDLVVKDRSGAIWCIDHKSKRTIPALDTFRSMDFQLTIYPWALEKQYGIRSTGTMYNYVRTRPPTKPQQLKSGLLSRRKIKTDELTFLRAVEEYDLDPRNFEEQWDRAKRSAKDFFFRARVPRTKMATASAVRDLVATAIHLHTYKFPLRNITERCEWCSFVELCQTQMFGLDDTEILRHFIVDDPHAYLGFEEDED